MRLSRRTGLQAALLLAAGVRPAGAAEPDPWQVDGRPGALAHEALALLEAADSHGLEPADYGTAALRAALGRGDTAGLAAALQRYLHDLHRGRVEPQRIHPQFRPPPRPPFDAAAALNQALAGGRLAAAAAALAPPLPQYERLRTALAQHRAMDGAAWRQPLPPWPAGQRSLDPGAAWPGLPALAERLRVLGDLAPDALVPAAYEGALVEAVRRFQQRHGLTDDGRIGRATLAALDVPPAARVQQIALGLERLRWTPLLQGPRMVVVNIPEFVLRAYTVENGRIAVRETMRVIVGAAFDHGTPLLAEDMRSIEFSPYWNVPRSIARQELVPRLRRDPAHWAHEGFEFVGPGGEVQTTLSAARLQAVLAGSWRIRQRPGPRNALGDIKFVFPNAEAIYLHHTPATQLFDRQRRDFSHGCIRVEAPLALARFVLQDQPDWTAARIQAAMAQGTSQTLRLQAPLPVLIAYGTVLVKEGRPFFFDDLYGHDRRLAAALRRHSQTVQAVQAPPPAR